MRLVGEVGPEGWHVRTQSIKDQGSRIKDKDRGSRTRIKDQGSRIKDQGSRIQDQGSRIKDHGPCFGTNEHPRRDTDVILRQSKASIDIFKFL